METNQQISTNNEANKKRQDAPQRIDHTPQKKKKTQLEQRAKNPSAVSNDFQASEIPDFFFLFLRDKKRSLYVNRNQRSLVTTDSSASRHQSFWFFKNSLTGKMSIGEIGELVVCLLQHEEGMSQFSKISD